MLKQQGAWLRGSGPDADIVISSRIRLARNLAGYPFISRIPEFDRRNIIRSFQATIDKVFDPDSFFFLEMDQLEAADRQYLLERQLVSREFVEDDKPRAVLIDRNEDFSVMVNEEDHLRIQAMTSGFGFASVWNRVNRLDDALEHELPFAFDERLGYLTACPSNLGTGIRVSVMLHLPAILETGEMERVFRGVQKINLAVRGIYGEGSRALGDFYQISNQTTLGVSEDDLMERLGNIIPRVIEYERRARDFLLENSREPLLDRCYRALGILSSARRIGAEEAMGLLSSARLGWHMKLQNEISVDKINDLLLHIQPAHLAKIADRELDEETESVFRAEYLRKRLAEKA